MRWNKFNIIQCNTLWYNTTQYSIIRHNKIEQKKGSPAVLPIIIAPKGLSIRLAVQPIATPPEELEWEDDVRIQRSRVSTVRGALTGYHIVSYCMLLYAIVLFCVLPANVAFCISTGLNLLFEERKEDIQNAAIVLAERDRIVFTIALCCCSESATAAPATKDGLPYRIPERVE